MLPRPGPWLLPSGRCVRLREQWVDSEWLDRENDVLMHTVDLSGGVMLVADESRLERGFVQLRLWWSSVPARYDDPVVELEAAAHASVVMGPGGLAVTKAVWNPHQMCECCIDSDVQDTSFQVWVKPAEVEPYVDVLGGLPLKDGDVHAHADWATDLWRGRYDAREFDRSFEVVSAVDLGLPPPPAALAVPFAH